MGYFSNGTEGDMYQERYCSRCIHGENDECPVWDAHLLYNGDSLLHQEVLDMFIPQTATDNGQCLMFAERQPRECRCSLRTRLVGDGCDVCNPELAAEYARRREATDGD